MGTEVEHASGDVQMNVTTPSSTTSTSGPKISMFAKKSGFVIPKNKLSGSLVPICRGTKKGDADLMNEEANNQVSRKTKWGPDLTLHTTVRRGRALAYQTRIDQISQQLTLGTLELEGDDDSVSTSDYQLSKEESELVELERREIIGELLKLNPNFKAPADYKPLLKEAKVPIPTERVQVAASSPASSTKESAREHMIASSSASSIKEGVGKQATYVASSSLEQVVESSFASSTKEGAEKQAPSVASSTKEGAKEQATSAASSTKEGASSNDKS
ncbi:hypothetical protein OROHE_017358 [Orobanche hederae]